MECILYLPCMVCIYAPSLAGWLNSLNFLVTFTVKFILSNSFEPETALPLEGEGVAEEIIPLNREHQETVTT